MAKSKKSSSRKRSEVKSIRKKNTVVKRSGPVKKSVKKAPIPVKKVVKKSSVQSKSGRGRMEGPKKGRTNKVLSRRNKISQLLSKYLIEQRIDLLAANIANNETSEILYSDGGERSTMSGRFNLVVSNIYRATYELKIKTISESFDQIYKDDSGVLKTLSRKYEDKFYFFDYREVFSRPIFESVNIKLTVAIPFVGQEGVYTGSDDPRLVNGIFKSVEIQDWFGTSNCYALCRDWDKANGSPIIEFGLEPGATDQYVHYHLTVYSDFFDRIEEKGEIRQAPLEQSVNFDEQVNEIERRIDSLKKSLEYLTGKDKDIVNGQIEDDSIRLAILKRTKTPTSSPSAESNEIEKIRLQKEIENIRASEEEKKRAHEIQLMKIKLSEAKIRVMQDMVSRGFTYDQIKDLLGEEPEQQEL